MLSILIDNQPVFIAKGTTFRLQMQNSAFNVNRIEGDILFTFDVPASKNDIVFKHARFVYVQRYKKYGCRLLAGGVEIANGDLYIQKSSCSQYTCGLVLNPLPQDFSEKKLSENDYGEAITISRNSREHRSKFKEFLRNSLNENSVFKFPLFLDSAFYGTSNEDFGWHLLPSDNQSGNNPSGFQASLNTDDNAGLDRCYLNRLFVNSAGALVEAFSNRNRGIRIFNSETVSNPNSFAFAPAIRLVWILEKVLANAGYRLCGNFHSSKDIRRIFSQSLRALDGLPSQYEGDQAGVSVTIAPNVNFENQTEEELILHFDTLSSGQACYFKPSANGTYQFSVSINTYLPANFLAQGSIPDDGITFKEAVIFMLLDEYDDFPEYLYGYVAEDWNNGIGYMDNGVWTSFGQYFKIYTLDQLQSQIGYTGAGFYSFNFNFSQTLIAGRKYCFFFGKMRGNTFVNIYTTQLTGYQNIPITQEISTFYKVHNAFANKMNFEEHVPGLTNGEFITRLCNAFGLSMFMDSASGQIELSFFKDMLGAHNALDLTDYLLEKESFMEKNEERRYIFKGECLHGEEIDETKLLPPVRTHAQLPNATTNFGRICFVENENQYRIAERVGDAVENWIFVWNPYGGNNQTLEIGEGEKEEISTGFISPNMKITDEKSHYTNLVLQIETEGCSPVFNTGNSEFEMVLVNYHGREEMKFDGGNRVYYESASPVNLGRNGENKGGISLSVSGDHSLKQLVAPWLEFLSSHEKVHHRFIFPLHVFLEVIRLLKPQDAPPEKQVRWALVGNIRLMPVKMDFQFTEGSGNILADIEFAKERAEV
ncbi:hypothetical protein LJC53_07330 [Bacteroidales bacterium OttesenSCG-928-C03]|nr:hypothetical protein [Bacteroidales bacterium OttesenSCG-928-C03]